MAPIPAVLLRRLDLHLRQLDPDIELEEEPLQRIYTLGGETLAVILPHRDLFRLRTGANPCWEARIRTPEEALEALGRILDRYWQIVSDRRDGAC